MLPKLIIATKLHSLSALYCRCLCVSVPQVENVDGRQDTQSPGNPDPNSATAHYGHWTLTGLSATLSLSASFLDLSLSPVYFSFLTNRPRRMAALQSPGPARGFFLIREFFLAIVAHACSGGHCWLSICKAL